jgi:hypothetical protein
MKVSKATSTERPKALDTLVGIVDLAISHRFVEHAPTVSDIARVTSMASRCLRIRDLDERIEVENQTTIAVAKRLNVIG